LAAALVAAPSNLTGGEIGNIGNFMLDTEGQMPEIIQFKVAGDEK